MDPNIGIEEKWRIKYEMAKQELDQLKQEYSVKQFELDHKNFMLEQVLDAMIVFDQSFHFVDVNDITCKLFELTKETLLRKNLKDFLEKKDLEKLSFKKQKFLQRGYLKGELTIHLLDGTYKYVEYTIKRDTYSHYYIAIGRDITSKKQLESEKNMSEELFHELFHHAIDGMIVFDEMGKCIDANPSFCKLAGLSKNELAYRDFRIFIEKNQKERIRSINKSLLETGKARGEIRVVFTKNEIKYVEFTVNSIGFNGFYVAIVRDITEKRKMEKRLFDSEQRFRNIFENAVDAILLLNNNGQVIRANKAASKMFEISRDKLVKSKVFEFIDKRDPELRHILKKYLRTGTLREELLFSMPNGQMKQLEFTAKRDYITGQHLTIFRNVSERNMMEKELRESEQKFRKIFDGAMDGIILFNDEFYVIDGNLAASKILEVPLNKSKNQRIFELISDINTEVVGPDKNCIFCEQDEFSEEFSTTLLNGTEKIIEWSLRRGILENLNIVIFRDKTERKEMEERLRKSDTLNVVGELAAGIAHEIRNPMTALKGFIQLLKGSLENDYSMYFNIISSELNRIETIITEFLILAKPQAVRFQKENIVKIMKETIELLSPQAILVNVQIQLSYDDQLPNIYCEANQLKQVFINIIKNAIEVMEDGGEIQVRIKNKGKNMIQLFIKDEGTGIPKDKIKRLGEPFYTTKERGTGLGLMVSYKIIEEHEGTVRVWSKEGEGTTFSISLPTKHQNI
ncbi:PAS domain S-box protein [Bacillus carboniphilus]|uniref:histidine kinase n=1 Tax=Bacillus carboniphilus TaxID=86663 RepID=A0ABY9JUN0_9BACI|nr:PAS domain S-box protein [Bacillus carboniphilus]WLR43119.1 PAS domain S-box protein [Bacillus carboniphilus]